MRMRNPVAGIALAVAISLGAGACADEGNSTEHSRDDYVALLAGGGEGLSDQEAQCISEAVVDTVGVGALEEAGVWDKALDDPEGALADFGVVVDDAQVAVIGEGVGGCVELAQVFQEMSAADGEMSPEAAACLTTGLGDAMLQRIIATAIVMGDAGLDADAELVTALETTARSCAEQGIT
jgi:hypothetical protein